MNLTRRQFLILSGFVGSGTLAGLAHQAPWQQLRQPQLPTPASDAILHSRSSRPAQAARVGKAIAPKGMFAPLRGDVRIVVISDLNSQYGSTHYEPEVGKAIALIPDWQPDLVLCSGDMIAGQSQALSGSQIQAMWTAFDAIIAAPLRRAKIPFGFTIGNHDGSSAFASSGEFLFAQDRAAAAAYWQQPQHQLGLMFVDRTQFPFYYSFQQNGIFYLVWDASSAIITPAQQVWVENSLRTPAARAAKLRIAIGHLPLYAIAKGRDQAGEFLENADQLRSLLERHHVHTYISGHHHAYFPGRCGQLQLLYTGALGSGPRHLINSDRPPQKTLTVVDITLNSATTRYTTYDMQTRQRLDDRLLPKLIAGPNGVVLRQDMQVNDLTAAEQLLV